MALDCPTADIRCNHSWPFLYISSRPSTHPSHTVTPLRPIIPSLFIAALLLTGCASERYQAQMRKEKAEKE